jgi:hypothetical protein
MLIPDSLPLDLRWRINGLETVCPVILAVLDRGELQYPYVSEPLANALGYQASNLTKHNLRQLFAGKSQSEIDSAIRDRLLLMQQYMVSKPPVQRSIPVKAKDGRIIPLSATAIFFYADDQPVCLVQTNLHKLVQEMALDPLPERCHGFICYARRDIPPDLPQDETKPIELQRLAKRRGISLWLDTRSLPLSKPFRQEIEQAIIASDRLIFLAGRYSAVSAWCRYEVDLALKYGKQILVLKIDNGGELTLTEPQWRFLYPDRANEWNSIAASGHHVVVASTNDLLRRNFPELMRLSHFDWTSDDITASYGAAINAILFEIIEAGRQPEYHTQLLQAAIAWDNAHRPVQELLSGNRITDAIALLKIDAEPNICCELMLDFVSESIAYSQGGAHAFLSGDSAGVTALRPQLQRAAVSVWQSPGKTTERAAILRAQWQIEQAANFVFVSSDAALFDQTCQAELAYANHVGKPLAIALHDGDDAVYRQEMPTAPVVRLSDKSALSNLLKIIDNHLPHKLRHGQLLSTERDYRTKGRLIPSTEAVAALEQFHKSSTLTQPRLSRVLVTLLEQSARHGRVLRYLTPAQAELLLIIGWASELFIALYLFLK